LQKAWLSSDLGFLPVAGWLPTCFCTPTSKDTALSVSLAQQTNHLLLLVCYADIAAHPDLKNST
jgi:hypothetical protein